jgi:hypothetical protein
MTYNPITEDPRFTKLPKWVQRKVENLKMHHDYFEKRCRKLEAIYKGEGGPTPWFINNYDRPDSPIDEHTVSAQLGDVRLDFRHITGDEIIQVYAQGGKHQDTMWIKPVSGNVFSIGIRDRS